MDIDITVAVEGSTDAVVVRRLIADAGLRMGAVHGQRGKPYLDGQLRGFNSAARHAPWLVLRDLDHDAACAPELLRRLMPAPASHMRFRIAVREMEAWLLADRAGISRFLQVPADAVPSDVESLDSPKLTLVDLARRSRSARVREDMAPAPGFSSRVGPAYLPRVEEFVSSHWDPEAASRNSPSLASCRRVLATWTTSS